VLKRFRILLVIDADLPEPVRELIRKAGRETVWLTPDLAGLDAVVATLRQSVAPDAPELPPNIIVAYADRQVTVFERKGLEGTVRLRLLVPGVKGDGRLLNSQGKEVFTGLATTLKQAGLELKLAPWECTTLHWQP